MPLEEADIIKYKPLYVQTARAYLNDMQRNVGLLLVNVENQNALDVLHLASHSLSSQSTMMGYVSIASYASLLERVSNARKEGKFTFTHELMIVVDEGIKHLHESVNEIEKNGKETDLAPETQKLQDATQLK